MAEEGVPRKQTRAPGERSRARIVEQAARLATIEGIAVQDDLTSDVRSQLPTLRPRSRCHSSSCARASGLPSSSASCACV